MKLLFGSRAALPTALGLAVLAAASTACSGEVDPSVASPEATTADLAALEAAAVRVEQDLSALILEPLSRGALAEAERGLATRDFAARIPALTDSTDAGEVRVTWVEPSASTTDSPARFLAELRSLSPTVGDPARVECELERFELATDGASATGRARLRWAGRWSPGTPESSRADLTLYADVRVVQRSGDWLLARFDPAGHDAVRPHALGAGARLVGGPPRFVERTRAVGLTFGTSPQNRELLQAFIDRHRTLTLGGLTVCDVDGDDRPDLIATRSEEASLVFRNDGVSGFVPEPLPIERLGDRPAFVLWVDLDGDGLEEIVASEASRYEGDRAFAGLWTRTGTDGATWRHLPRAFAMPNPVGRRRLAVQTVAPFDLDGDGDLDLFFAVYGDATSRGERYNTVEAYDGADNHLFVNQGDLQFTEESEARGVSGTGYTYVALAFDADHDGDPDLFEGNDFGPNVLWRNDGGSFVADDRLGFDGVSAYTMGAALGDLDADGRWDLYVSNMSSEEGMRMVPHAADLAPTMRQRVDTIARGNMLYSEGPPGAPWRERAELLGVHEGEWAWGCQFLDVDGDGAQELGVTNGFASHRDRSLGDWQSYYWRQVLDDAVRLQRAEKTRDVNAALRFRGSFNGHERDRLYARTAGTDTDRAWVDAGWLSGLDAAHDGRALVPIDADGDGDLDLALWTLTGLVFYENTGPPVDWCRLRLVPRGGGPALGARVRLTSRGRAIARHVGLVEGFQSQVSPDIHIGLGASGTAEVVEIEIEWPGGERETVSAAPIGRLLLIEEGRGVTEARELPRWPSSLTDSLGRRALQPTTGGPGWTSELARIARTPAALGMSNAVPLVVNVSETGVPSDASVAALSAIETDARVVVARLRAGPGRQPGSAAAGRRHPDRNVELDAELFADALGTAGETTVVYDALGEPLRILRGPLEPERGGRALTGFVELARDERPFPHLLVEHGRLALEESRYRDALELFTEAVRDRRDLSVRDAAAFEGLARAHVLLGRVDLAEPHYRRAVEVDPDYAIGHFNLGVTLTHLSRFQEAIASLEEARRIEGDSERVLGALLDAAAAGGDDQGARDYGARLLQLRPEDAGVRIVLGKVEARAGRLSDALVHLDAALAARPGDAEAIAARRKVQELLSRQGSGSED